MGVRDFKPSEEYPMANKRIEIRFSEVDSMGIVWHGSYPLYFEDAREQFGNVHGLSYDLIYSSGYYAPLVELNFNYRKPLKYGDKIDVKIYYIPTEAAKILFEYQIFNAETGELCATGRSLQVFMDRDYQLVWDNPAFYSEWKRKTLGEKA